MNEYDFEDEKGSFSLHRELRAQHLVAEYFLQELGKNRFEAYSAGAQPTGRINPLTLEILKDDYHLDVKDARSKSVEAFDNARQTCPILPGGPTTIHWDIADPAAAAGTADEKLQAFRNAARTIRRRVQLLCALPDDKLATLREGESE